MRRVLHAGLIILIVTFFALPPLSAAPRNPRGQGPPSRGPYVTDEVLVQFKADVRPDVAAAAVGARVHGRIEGLGVHVLKVPEGTVDATVRALSNNPLVEFAEPNFYAQAFVNDPNDPYDNPLSCPYQSSDGSFTCQWYWSTVKAYDAWGVTTGLNTVRVAVVDTGIDVGGVSQFGVPDGKHPDLAVCNRTVDLKSYVSGETGNDDNGHGTHVAGVIGACTNVPPPNDTGIAGANWNVRLMAVKVLDYSGSGSYSAVASGIRYAADNGAQVINLSLGGSSPSRTLKRAVDYAWSKNSVLVCAAGNSYNSAPSYPARYDHCLAVAATVKNDAKASFSTYGTWVEMAAPGVQILSLIQDTWEWCFLCYWYGYYEGYDSLSGTSMATSVVSGLAALIWSVPGLCSTNSCVRSRIENFADQIPGTGTYWTKGRVNYFNSVSAP